MKVLLINPPMQVDMEPRFPSFGIAYIYHAMRKAGHEVVFIDIDANRYPKDHVRDVIRGSGADVVAIGGLVTVYPYLAWLVPEIKRIVPSRPVILGGPVASSLKGSAFLRFPIDFAVIGEGEETIVELLSEIGGARHFDRVKGIGYRKDGKIAFTEHRPLLPTLSDVPVFDDSLFPMEKLLKNTGGAFQIHTQRGCPSSCTFCFNAFRVVSGKVRYRPVMHVINEIEHFRDKYGDKVSIFALAGECITMNKAWLEEFCRTMIERKPGIKFRVTSRVDTVDEEKLSWLKAAGCASISFGLESGSAKILGIMNKRTTAEKGLMAVRLARKYIPNIEASIMLGYIGEDAATLKETLAFCKDIGVRPEIFYATPFPGTELYRMAVEKGAIKDEEAYMMSLDKRLIFDMSINLTDMPAEEAVRAVAAVSKEVERYYFVRRMLGLGMYVDIVKRLSREGLKPVVSRAAAKLNRLFKR